MPWKFRRLPEDQPAGASPIVGPDEWVFVELFGGGAIQVTPPIEQLEPKARRWVHEVALPELRAEWAEHELREAELEADAPVLDRWRERRQAERRCLERSAPRRRLERQLIAKPPRPGMTKLELRRWAGKQAREILARPKPTPSEQMRIKYEQMAFGLLAFEAFVARNGHEDY